MENINLSSLIGELKLRKEREDLIIKTLYSGFEPSDDASYRQAANAGQVYAFLAAQLNEKNHCTFRREIKALLLKKQIIKIANNFGRVWFIGLTSDKSNKGERLLQKHYQYQHAYEQRQKDK